jgi:hypothetical protein
MIYSSKSALFRRFLTDGISAPATDPCVSESDWEEDLQWNEDPYKHVNRQWKKDLKEIYMKSTTILLCILKPVEEWTKIPEAGVQQLLQDKASECCVRFFYFF